MYSINVDILSSLFIHRLLFNILLYMYNIHHIRDLLSVLTFYSTTIMLYTFILFYSTNVTIASPPSRVTLAGIGSYRVTTSPVYTWNIKTFVDICKYQ